MGKLIWNLLSSKTSIWADWVHGNLLKGKSFWSARVPSNSSWNWRKLLEIKEVYRGHFLHIIGNGTSTSLWFDYWLPDGKRPCHLYPMRTLSSIHLPWNARVSDIILDGRWSFPSNTSDTQELWDSINFHLNGDSEDSFMWTGSASGQFTIKSAWELLRPSHPEINGNNFLWHK